MNIRLSRHQTTNNFFVAILLNIAVWGGITLSRTYIDVLLLSNYGTSLLPYFFLGQTLLVLLVTFALIPLAQHGTPQTNFLLFNFIGVSVAAGYVFLNTGIAGFAFMFTLWLSVIPVVLLVVSLNAIADAFDVRQLKKNLTIINAAGSFSGLLIGLFIPSIIDFFGIDSLLFLLALCLIVAAFCFLYIKALPTTMTRRNAGQSPFNYPLFRYVAWCTLFLMVVDTLVDYALKVELNNTFNDKDDIGRFMGPFYGISNFLILALQLLGVSTLLKWAGVASLLLVIPWFCGLSSLVLMSISNLWIVAFVRLGENAFRFSFFSVGREIIMKPLPAQIRRAGKFLITAAGYVGAGFASIALLLFAHRLGIQAVAVVILLTSIIWIIVGRRLHKSYQDTLEEAIRVKRFNIDTDESLSANQDNMLNMMRLSFNDKDVDTIRFGFTLLKKSELKTMPEESFSHLDSPDVEVRVDFLQTAYELDDKSVLPLLIERLEKEQDGKVLWWLLKTLSMMDHRLVLDQTDRWLHSSLPLARAGAIVVLLTHGNLEQLIQAAQQLQHMINSRDPLMRRGASYAISALQVGDMKHELQNLIRDPVEVVSIAAMWAIADQRNYFFIPMLVSKLGKGRAAYYAGRTLVKLGEPALPHLLPLLSQEQEKASMIRVVVRIVTQIRGNAAELAIAQVASDGGVLTRTALAKACAMRSRYYDHGNYLIQQARDWVQKEVDILKQLKAALLLDNLVKHQRLEITQRLRMAESRLLYWFDVATPDVELGGVIPVLLQQSNTSTHAAALEFLETQTRDRTLRRAINIFEYHPALEDSREALQNLQTLNDPWLQAVIEWDPPSRVQKRDSMDITEKVMLLRKVKLFMNLPGETLLTIAETCEEREIIRDQKLFAMGDHPDGMYIIASGKVAISKAEQVLVELKEYDFFGEIGLFDESPRMADAIATSDGMILFLQKEVFDGITEDLPEVLRALVRTVIGYLK